ncbi:MAG: radical SAM protein [Syntrophotaleaceae bacterium]
MTMPSLQPARPSAHCSTADIEMITSLVAWRQRCDCSEDLIEELIGALADVREPIAMEAVSLLNQRVPLAAMPKRWVDEGPPPRTAASIPDWILNSCAGWGETHDFPSRCARAYTQIDNEAARQRFLQRMAMFPGAQRRFAGTLKASGHSAAARSFSRHAVRLRREQFPIQIGLSPTMACQLRCDYCISAGSPVQHPEPVETFFRFLDWAVDAGVKRIGLSGGEPTLYSGFIPLVEGIVRRKMDWFMATNGLIPPKTVETVISGHPLAVTMHLTDEVLADALRLKTFTTTAKQLVEAGVNAVLRINILQPKMEIARYLDIAAATGMREVRAAVPMPNALRHNTYVPADHFGAFGEALQRFVLAGRQRRLQTILSKPFPLCYMAEEVAATFLANGSMAANCPVHLLGYSNNIVVSPDLTYIPCLGLNRPDPMPITSRRSPRAAARPFMADIRRMSAIPLLPRCTGCPLWQGGRCIGGCLSYRVGTEGEKSSE